MKWDNKDHHPFPGNTEKAKFEPKMLDCCPGWGKEDAAIVLAGEALTGFEALERGFPVFRQGAYTPQNSPGWRCFLAFTYCNPVQALAGEGGRGFLDWSRGEMGGAI